MWKKIAFCCKLLLLPSNNGKLNAAVDAVTTYFIVAFNKILMFLLDRLWVWIRRQERWRRQGWLTLNGPHCVLMEVFLTRLSYYIADMMFDHRLPNSVRFEIVQTDSKLPTRINDSNVVKRHLYKHLKTNISLIFLVSLVVHDPQSFFVPPNFYLVSYFH